MPTGCLLSCSMESAQHADRCGAKLLEFRAVKKENEMKSNDVKVTKKPSSELFPMFWISRYARIVPGSSADWGRH